MRNNGAQPPDPKNKPSKQDRAENPAPPADGELTNEAIISRCKAGTLFMNRFSSIDKACCQTFRDATGQDVYTDYERVMDEDANVLDNQPVGVTNQFQINALLLAAAIASKEPDFFVRSKETRGLVGGGHSVRQDLLRQWKNKDWTRKTRACLQKWIIGGLGCMAYRWDKDRGTVLEWCHSWDLVIDPCVTDWTDLHWGGRKIWMSLREAMKRYDPDGKEGHFKEKLNDQKGEDDKHAILDRLRIQITIYWDDKNECILYNNKVIKRAKNRFGEVPLVFLLNIIDPGPTAFPIGYGIITSGLQQQITDLDTMITSTAKNGIPLNIFDETLMSKSLQQTWTDARQQGAATVKGNPQEAFSRIPGEDLSEAPIMARREAKSALHAVMGTNDMMAGQHTEGVQKATEMAFLAQTSGSRQVQARQDFEIFLDRLMIRVVKCESEWGGAVMKDGYVDVSEDARDLHKAYKSVTEIYVTDSSTVYRDPQQDQQQCMQLYKLGLDAVKMFAALNVPGPMLAVLLLRLQIDALRAFGRTNVDEYMPGVTQFMALLAQTYVPGLEQGQLPPLPQQQQEQQQEPPGARAQEMGVLLKAQEAQQKQKADLLKHLSDQQHEKEMQDREHRHEVGLRLMSVGNGAGDGGME